MGQLYRHVIQRAKGRPTAAGGRGGGQKPARRLALRVVDYGNGAVLLHAHTPAVKPSACKLATCAEIAFSRIGASSIATRPLSEMLSLASEGMA